MSRLQKEIRFDSCESESEFKRLRKSAKLSQEKLATDLGRAVSTIRRWEKGTCEPTFTLAQVRSLIQATGKDLNLLPEQFKQN